MNQQILVENAGVARRPVMPMMGGNAISPIARAPMRRPSGVLVRGAVYGGSGYSEETLAVVLGLAKRGIPVELQPMHMRSDALHLLAPEVREHLEVLKTQRVDPATSVLFQCATADEFSLDMHARFRIGRTTFETDRLPIGWLEACRSMDEVWVPSQFNRQVFAAEGVDERKIRVLPEGVPTETYRPGIEPLPLPHLRDFNFLSIFEWTQRKGPDVLLRAYLTEFTADDDVALIVKTYARPDPRIEILPRLVHFIEREVGLRLEKAPAIILLPGFMRNEEMPRLYNSAEAFVLPSRGEGWGRPYMEALACERPVVATRWSGQMDFLNDRNSYLVDCKVTSAPSNIDVELYAGHSWAEPNVEHLRHQMRHVFTHREEAKRLAAQGRREMVERWDTNIVIEQWMAEFLRLLGN
jgi:glycosyltransferase involved in cell wall biosynthesis